ncbi:unnamed protein product [Phytophthora fragariaefolia]|uniref:Unnamed protein product n=1 Tax=Phytophthora fragariaefolia TaxID=1490495 RepID=A0A9W6YMD2_9STRA|nr:unnamed protein product [Phytophthora fragariaefolia]
MESLGATELAVLYDFFDDNGIIGDFILTPRETPLTATELSSQLKNFTVKREPASILSQFDSKQLALRTFGTVSLLRKVAAKYDRIKRKLAEDDGAASVIGLQDEALRLKRDQQFQSSYWIEKVAEMSQGGVGGGTGVPKSTCISIARPASPDGTYYELPSRAHDSDDELAAASRPTGPLGVRNTSPSGMADGHYHHGQRQLGLPSSAVRMDPPQDEDDEETKESDPPAPDSFLDLSRGASTTKFRSKSSQLGKRSSGSQSPKSNEKQAPDSLGQVWRITQSSGRTFVETSSS